MRRYLFDVHFIGGSSVRVLYLADDAQEVQDRFLDAFRKGGFQTFDTPRPVSPREIENGAYPVETTTVNMRHVTHGTIVSWEDVTEQYIKRFEQGRRAYCVKITFESEADPVYAKVWATSAHAALSEVEGKLRSRSVTGKVQFPGWFTGQIVSVDQNDADQISTDEPPVELATEKPDANGETQADRADMSRGDA
jgi:hypothetical protein